LCAPAPGVPRHPGVCVMWKFAATAKRVLWEFVELAFLTVLALVLIFLLLGKDAGPYVVSVADNVTKFSAGASSGMLGIVLVLAIIYLAMRRLNPPRGTRSRSRD
jgi:cytochrome bd-type quinol oxidase subunit 2